MPPWRILPAANPPLAAASAPPPLTSATSITPVAPLTAATAVMTPAAPAAVVTLAAPSLVTPPQLPVAVAVHASPPPLAPVAPPPLTAVAHAGPPALPPEPARAQPPALPYEDARPLIRAAIDEAMVPVHQALRDLVRRVDELEKRPATVVTQAAPVVREAYRHSMPSYPPPITTHAAVLPQAPTLDIAAINRDVHIDMDGALDGSKRRRRLALTFVLVLLIVFGGLFGALAHSYAPHGSSLNTPPTVCALV
jgi:hypothetical protein